MVPPAKPRRRRDPCGRDAYCSRFKMREVCVIVPKMVVA
jgi:hypothetical protein